VGKRQVDVSEEQVQQWAEETLQHELPGYFTPDVEGVTYQVVHVGPDKFTVKACYPSDSEPRTFVVQVSVTEL